MLTAAAGGDVSMETRKLQEVGGGTYTVSIPKEWATEHGLEAGTAVNLYTHLDGSIVVRSRERDDGPLVSARVDVDGGAATATRTLRAAQAVGFERVTLVAREEFDPETTRAVRSLVRRFVGTELVEEGDCEMTVRNLLDASDVSVRQTVVQLQYTALSVHRQATASLVDPDDSVGDRLDERAREAERLGGMVARHFSRALRSLAEVDRLGTSRADLFRYYEVARHLDRIARDGNRLARTAERLDDGASGAVAAELRPVADDARKVVEEAAGAVLERRDARAVHRVLDECDAVRADIDAIETALTADDRGDGPTRQEDVVAVVRTLDALGRTVEAGRAIAEVALRDTLRTAD